MPLLERKLRASGDEKKCSLRKITRRSEVLLLKRDESWRKNSDNKQRLILKSRKNR
jgi:hypothetical protein